MMSFSLQDLDDWLEGSKDCRDGLPQQHKSDWYDRGYKIQYEVEQRDTELVLSQERINRRIKT